MQYPPATCLHDDERLPTALFLTGPAACGKTTLAQAWVRHRVRLGEPWCILDKDVVGDVHGQRLLEVMGADPHDRDSDVFKREVRDLDYRATLKLAAQQLELGCSVVLPGPWTRELRGGLVHSPEALGLPECRSIVVWLSLSEADRRRRIEDRGHSRDGWKLANWDKYVHGLAGALPDCKGGRPHVLDARQTPAQLLEQLKSIVNLDPLALAA